MKKVKSVPAFLRPLTKKNKNNSINRYRYENFKKEKCQINDYNKYDILK